MPDRFLDLDRVHPPKIDACVLGRIEGVDALDLGGVGVDLPFVGRNFERQVARRQVAEQVAGDAAFTK